MSDDPTGTANRRGSEVDPHPAAMEQILEAIQSTGQVLGNVGVGLGLISADGRILWTNGFLRSFHEKKFQAGEPCRKALCDDVCEICPVEQAVEQDRVRRTVWALTDQDGNRRSFHVTCVPLRGADGPPSEVAVVLLEFTEQEVLARRLRAQERQILNIANRAADAIVILDPQRHITFWSDGAARFFGYTGEEVLGRRYEIIVPEEMRVAGELDEIDRIIREQGHLQDYETVRQSRDGRLVPVEVTVTLVRGADGTEEGRSVILKDLTERKRAYLKQQLVVSRLSTLNAIGDSIHGARDLEKVLEMTLVGVTAKEGLRFNRAFLLLVDEEHESLRGEIAIGPSGPEEAARIWAELEHLNLDVRGIMQHYRGAARQENVQVNRIVRDLEVPLEKVDHVLVRSFHRRRGVRLGLGAPDGEVPVDLAEALGVQALAAVPLIAAEKALGLLIADNVITGAEITDEDLELLRLFAHHAGTAIENSRLNLERRKTIKELRRAHDDLRENQEKLMELEKLSAVGEVAAKVAHEIRTPLVSIGGFANQIARSLPDGDRNLKSLTIIREEVLRLERIVTEMLDFVKSPVRNFSPGDLNDLVEKTAWLMSEEFAGRGVQIRTELQSGLPQVMMNHHQIHQVLTNLIHNAAQSMPTGGHVEVTTETGEAWVRLHVDDEGTGIPEEDRAKVFQAFYSTKESGSGLGLPIASQIVTQHQGRIHCRPRDEGGTRFTVELPWLPKSGGKSR